MTGRPQPEEAAPYYWTYINQVSFDDPLAALETQVEEVPRFFSSVSEEKSLYRYAPGKWSIRQALNHVTDSERAFAFRALWFARGFEAALPGYDQNIAVTGAEADRLTLSEHLRDFHQVRLSTLSLFRNLPADAWNRQGIASGYSFSVRALAFITAGHMAHHLRVIRERYRSV